MSTDLKNGLKYCGFPYAHSRGSLFGPGVGNILLISKTIE